MPSPLAIRSVPTSRDRERGATWSEPPRSGRAGGRGGWGAGGAPPGPGAVACGDRVRACCARPRAWGDVVGAAAERSGEWFWEMPLVPEYRASYDSPHADIVNSGSRDGSLIKSAIFISEFATVPWVHVDIAGTAYLGA